MMRNIAEAKNCFLASKKWVLSISPCLALEIRRHRARFNLRRADRTRFPKRTLWSAMSNSSCL